MTPSVGSHRLVALLFALLLAIGLWSSAGTVAREVSGYRDFASLDGLRGFLARMNGALRLPFSREINPIAAGIGYRLFGDLGTQVTEGCPEWMFYNDGFHATVSGTRAFRQRLALAKHYVEELKKTGAFLLVVTVPDKARIETEALCGLRLAPQISDRLDAWHRALRTMDVAHLDLRGAFVQARPAFFRTDVHWNEEGAHAAAVAVARAALPVLNGKGVQEFLITRATSMQPRIGDLLTLAGLDHAPENWRPAPDQERPSRIEVIRRGGLLDEPSSPEVMIAGSSSSLRSNFAEWLGYELGRELWNRSFDGVLFAGSLQAALRDRERWPHSLHFVIWELPEMSLTLPLTDEERKAVAALKQE